MFDEDGRTVSFPELAALYIYFQIVSNKVEAYGNQRMVHHTPNSQTLMSKTVQSLYISPETKFIRHLLRRGSQTCPEQHMAEAAAAAEALAVSSAGICGLFEDGAFS